QDPTNMAVEALSEIALVLLLITVVVNFAARLLLWMARVR
ncbi:phosphate ABC transporter permease subunit PstC, partial [Acidithiobacillus ferrooxidans]|nr:phosphate ABC transporter permease subunit PstC [Acidithiobacillus ferrooxidans]